MISDPDIIAKNLLVDNKCSNCGFASLSLQGHECNSMQRLMIVHKDKEHIERMYIDPGYTCEYWKEHLYASANGKKWEI